MMTQQGPGIAAGNPALAAMRPAGGGMQQAQSMGTPPAAPRPQMAAAGGGPAAGGAMVPPTPQPPAAAPAQTAMRSNMMLQAGQAPSMNGGPGGPSYGQQWQPPGMGGGGQPWQPPWQQSGGNGGWGGQMPQAPQPQAPQQSMLQQALAGGSNPQQTQNFLHALQQAGAGSNNSYMSSGAQPQQQAQQLIGAPVQDNGGYGQTSYAGGFNQGMGGVSYNSGLAARPNQGGTASNPQGNTFFQGNAPQSQWSQPGNVSYPPANATNPTVQMPGLSGAPQAGGGGPTAAGGYRGPQVNPQQQPAPAQQSVNGGQAIADTLNKNINWHLAASDENLKENVLPGAEQTREFLSHLNAWEYDYKDPKHGEGRYVSPMAQELEKTPIGKSAVIETPEGKMVHYGRLAGVTLAAAADFHKRLNALEAKK